MTTIINYSNQNFARVLTINQQEIKLINVCQQGICVKCQTEQEIRLISEQKTKINQFKQYCGSCSLTTLRQLEQSNYDFPNKEQVIKQLKAELNNKPTEVYHACKYCPINTQQTLTSYIHSHKWFKLKDCSLVWRCKDWQEESKNENFIEEPINIYHK